MKLYDLKDEKERVFAFEVDNTSFGRDELCRVVGEIHGATLVRRPAGFLSWFRESEFCEFELDGVRFAANEGPWGDSSRYWLGPKPPRWVPQLDAVRQAFQEHQPDGPARSLLVRIAIGGALVAVMVWAWRHSR